MTGAAIVIGTCIGHGGLFLFDPDRVPSILFDHDAGTSVELGGDPAKAVREPICPRCARAANPRRRASGFELIYEGDTAEDAARGLS